MEILRTALEYEMQALEEETKKKAMEEEFQSLSKTICEQLKVCPHCAHKIKKDSKYLYWDIAKGTDKKEPMSNWKVVYRVVAFCPKCGTSWKTDDLITTKFPREVKKRLKVDSGYGFCNLDIKE